MSLVLLLVLLFTLSGCSDKRAANCKYLTADKTVYASFSLSSDYKGINPLEDLSAEELKKKQKEASSANPVAHYEIYKNDVLVAQFYFTGLNLYDTQAARAKENFTTKTGDTYSLIEDKSNNQFEYVFYSLESSNTNLSGYYYLGKFSKIEDLGFKLYSNSSREEIESIFDAMVIWVE